MDNGKLYMQDDDGKVYPLGEIKDISAEEAEISEEDKKTIELMKKHSLSFSGTLAYDYYAIIYVWLAHKPYEKCRIGRVEVVPNFEEALDILANRHDAIGKIPKKTAELLVSNELVRKYILKKHHCLCSPRVIYANVFAPINFIDDVLIYVVKLRR